MRRLSRDNHRPKICLSLVEESARAMRRAIAAGNRGADLMEIRMDYVRDAALEALLKAAKRPVIVTNRRREEGGRFAGPEEIRVRVLEEAQRLGASFIDIDWASGMSALRPFLSSGEKRTRTILSFHDTKGTPSAAALRRLCREMMSCRPGVVKIVTAAREWGDNFRVLSLLAYARKRNQKIVAFCMGEKGKMTRVLAPLMGAPWAYASLNKKKSAAPGQLTMGELRGIWESLR